MKKFDKTKYDIEFHKNNYVHYHVAVPNKETDVNAKLKSVPNKNAYIIGLIKADMKK